jgi:Alginate export
MNLSPAGFRLSLTPFNAPSSNPNCGGGIGLARSMPRTRMIRPAILWVAGLLAFFSGSQLCAQEPTAPGDQAQVVKPTPSSANKHKLGAVEIGVNWRVRIEGWDWFEGDKDNSNYALGHSLLRVAVGQTSDRFEWQLEVAQATILGLPNDAVVPAPQGQLGLGGTYYAANGNNSNNAGVFVKQAFLQFNPHRRNLRIGRFEFIDGLEIQPKDPTLAALVQTRVSQRLIANFGFSAVQRSFDGAKFSTDIGKGNLTFFAARPTRGVFQVDGMGELDIDVYYGAFTLPVESGHNADDLRVFGIGYVDHRTSVLKMDNRPLASRSADHSKIEIGTYGADYLHVLNTAALGKFDVFGWGAIQTGSWGVLSQRAGAFVGELGWQPPVLEPWLSAGYSYGSGGGNPSDSRHGTFFQLLTTPRLYARFPFYNMMNNEDFYGTLNVHPGRKLMLRSEAHALRLATATDLWYLGGGAFQPQTFGYTGRASNGSRSLASVWDLSADYQITPSFSATLYYAHAWGKGVVANIYPNDRSGELVYLETNLRF